MAYLLVDFKQQFLVFFFLEVYGKNDLLRVFWVEILKLWYLKHAF